MTRARAPRQVERAYSQYQLGLTLKKGMADSKTCDDTNERRGFTGMVEDALAPTPPPQSGPPKPFSGPPKCAQF